MIDLEQLKKALESEGIDITDERFQRAFRHATNPGGCKHCGARTLVGVEGKKKNTIQSACCGRTI